MLKQSSALAYMLYLYWLHKLYILEELLRITEEQVYWKMVRYVIANTRR